MNLQKSSSMPYVILLGTLFGSNLVVSRYLLGQINSIAFVSLRLIIAALGYAVIFAFSKTHRWSRQPSVWLRSSVYGIIGTAIPMNAFIGSLNYLSSGVSALFITLSPPVTVLLAHFFLDDESLSWQKSIGVLIAFTGAGLLLLRGESGLADFARADWRGYALVLLGVFSASLSNIYSRKSLKEEDSLEVSSIFILSAAVVCLPIARLAGSFDLSALRPSGYLVLLYTGLVGSLLTFLLNFFIIKHFSATAGAASAYVSPVITAALGWFFLGELVTPTMLIGMLIVFTGLALIDRKPPIKMVV